MHVLTTLTGQLVCPAGPITDGWAAHHMTALATGGRVQTILISDRDDITVEQIEAQATEFLQMTGWADAAHDPQLIAEVAHEMAANCVEVASDYDVGDLLHAEFDVAAGEWNEEIIGSWDELTTSQLAPTAEK
jgi:hypothetical protein